MALSRRALAGKLMGVPTASRALTIAGAFPSGAFADVPAHATTLRLAASIVAMESESFVDSFPMPSTPVMGTTTRALSTSGIFG